MITFFCSLIALILGYVFYGKFVEKIFGANPNRTTPAYNQTDGIDYVPMKPWRVFMIQFLNIAGLGPIFGAVMGAKFGTSAYVWIVVGCIFAGAVHDYISGMISLRENGASLPEIISKYLGRRYYHTMRVFIIILLILVGVVFVSGPAGLLSSLTNNSNINYWIAIIFVYYLIATLLPIDKIIGKIYPIFSATLLFMAVGIIIAIIINRPELPEITDGLVNRHPNAENMPIFPMVFITIACGAISGFHSTQSPMMARCMTNEKYGRPIFYGAMITEGIVALIWAAAGIYFFSPEGQSFFGVTDNATINGNAAAIVDTISKKWLGLFGGILAILGVIAAPISTGDTAFRSARLMVADMFKIKQIKIKSRLIICIPLFLIAIVILVYSMKDTEGFSTIWRYFSWANQVLATVTLWTITSYLSQNNKKHTYFISLIPAMIMTVVVVSYILIAPEGLNAHHTQSYIAGIVVSLCCTASFFSRRAHRIRKEKKEAANLQVQSHPLSEN